VGRGNEVIHVTEPCGYKQKNVPTNNAKYFASKCSNIVTDY
jgi:hypothetical protein